MTGHNGFEPCYGSSQLGLGMFFIKKKRRCKPSRSYEGGTARKKSATAFPRWRLKIQR